MLKEKERGAVMSFQINCTRDGVKKYPFHKHNNYEIMVYFSGEGYMRTTDENYQFKDGTIIIMPPKLDHGSISENGFKNISIEGDFGQCLFFEKPVVLQDNDRREGRLLAEMILNNRHSENDYLKSLCMSFIYFVLQNLKIENSINIKVNKIVTEIMSRFYEHNLDLGAMLKKSGYAEDYIRSQFKLVTGKTPKQFLKDMRIKHACYMIEIYAKKMSLARIGEQCGYPDYIYFSKKFKEVMGISPSEYKNNIINLT